MPGLPTAASMVLASIRISAASGTIENDAGAGVGTSMRDRQARGGPGVEAAMQHLDLGIAEHGEEIIAAAGLAEAGIHRLFVDDGGFLARKPGLAEGVGEFRLQFVHALRRRGRKVGEDLVHVHGVGQMSRGIGIGIAGVDDDTRLRSSRVRRVRRQKSERPSWQASPVLVGLRGEVAVVKFGSIRNPLSKLRPPRASCAAAWWRASRWRRNRLRAAGAGRDGS